MKATCGNCRFFQPDGDVAKVGNCCLNPPQLVMGQAPTGLAGRVQVQPIGVSPPCPVDRPGCKEHRPAEIKTIDLVPKPLSGLVEILE